MYLSISSYIYIQASFALARLRLVQLREKRSISSPCLPSLSRQQTRRAQCLLPACGMVIVWEVNMIYVILAYMLVLYRQYSTTCTVLHKLYYTYYTIHTKLHYTILYYATDGPTPPLALACPHCSESFEPHEDQLHSLRAQLMREFRGDSSNEHSLVYTHLFICISMYISTYILTYTPCYIYRRHPFLRPQDKPSPQKLGLKRVL
jgi:hypothetical protein